MAKNTIKFLRSESSLYWSCVCEIGFFFFFFFFFFAVTVTGNVQNMKPVQMAQVSYFKHFTMLYMYIFKSKYFEFIFVNGISVHLYPHPSILRSAVAELVECST